MPDVVCSILHVILLKEGLSLKLKLIISAELDGQRAPGIGLSPRLNWD